MNEEIKAKIEKAANSYEDKRYKNESDMDYYGVSTCFEAGAEFGIREGFELAIELIRKQYDGFKGLVSNSIVASVIEVEGIQLGILPGGEGEGK